MLNVYFTAGYPALNDTLPVMKALQDAGADMVELGMPYSDPLADGPVIQSSSTKALANGMTIHKLFDQLKNFRKEIVENKNLIKISQEVKTFCVKFPLP